VEKSEWWCKRQLAKIGEGGGKGSGGVRVIERG
jgi:hypothetical protein